MRRGHGRGMAAVLIVRGVVDRLLGGTFVGSGQRVARLSKAKKKGAGLSVN